MDWNEKLSERARTMKASVIRELLKRTGDPEAISFAGGYPDPNLFPVQELAGITREVLLNPETTYRCLQYSQTEGIPELRELLVKMGKEEGIKSIAIDNVIVTTASQQALFLAGLIFLDPGDTIIVEAPSYVGALQAFDLMQPNIWTVPLDNNGIKVDILEKKLKKAEKKGINIKFIYVIPDFHNPAGVTLSLKRRYKIIELSHRYNVPIVEDDPYSEIRFKGRNLPSLVQLDDIDNVIAFRTFSKMLFPGLRLSEVIAAKEIIQKFGLAKQPVDLCSPAFTQFIALEFIKRGYMEDYLREVRKVYKKKRNTMLIALEKYFPKEIQWTEPDGGLFIWVTLPKYINADNLAKEAIEKEKVAFVMGSAFYHDGKDKNHLRLNFSLPDIHQIDLGIKRLGNLLKKKIESR